jgi:hypothetical protein
MVITLRNVGTAATAASGDVSPGLPSSWANDDIALLLVASRDNVTHSVSGWTQIQSQTNNGTGFTTSLWYRKLQTGDGNPTVSHTSGSQIAAVIIAYYNVDTSNPIHKSQSWYAKTPASTTTNFGGGVTTTIDNCMIVILAGTENRGTNSSYSGSPTPTERHDLPYNSNYPTLCIADFLLSPAGSTGARTATCNQSRLNNGIQVALLPSFKIIRFGDDVTKIRLLTTFRKTEKFNRRITDDIRLLTNYVSKKNIPKIISDTIRLIDHGRVLGTGSEKITLVSEIVRKTVTGAIKKIVDDTVRLLTTTIHHAHFIRIISHTVRLITASRKTERFVRRVAENLLLTESVYRRKAINKLISDTIRIIETVQRELFYFV